MFYHPARDPKSSIISGGGWDIVVSNAPPARPPVDAVLLFTRPIASSVTAPVVRLPTMSTMSTTRSSSVATHHPRIVPLLDPSIGNTFPSIQPSAIRRPSTVDRRRRRRRIFRRRRARVNIFTRRFETRRWRIFCLDPVPPKGPRAAPHRTCVRVRAFSYTPNVRTLFPPVPPRPDAMRCASTARLSFGFASGCDMKNIYPRDPWVGIHRTTDARSTTLCTHTHTHTALQTNKNKKHKTQNTKRSCIFAGKARLHNPARGRGKERKEKNIIDVWTRVYPIPSTS